MIGALTPYLDNEREHYRGARESLVQQFVDAIMVRLHDGEIEVEAAIKATARFAMSVRSLQAFSLYYCKAAVMWSAVGLAKGIVQAYERGHSGYQPFEPDLEPFELEDIDE